MATNTNLLDLSILLIRDPRRAVPRCRDGFVSWSKRNVTSIRAAILFSSLLLMLPGAWGHSVTVVEFAHLPAGLAAWQRHSLGIYRVCGPFSKFLYALPAHLAGVRVDYPASFDSDIRTRQEWELGRLFQLQNWERYHCIYRWSRLLPILVTLLGGILICEWSTRLFGVWPGVTSLCVWCWMAPVLAHGSLVTSDMPSAVATILAARSFWSFLFKPSLLTATLAGATLGIAPAVKFTLLIMYPCWVLILIGRVIQLRSAGVAASQPSSTRPVRLVVLGLVMIVISIAAINALYLFQGEVCCLAQWQPVLSSLTEGLHVLGENPATAWLLRIPLPVPLEFVRGLNVQLVDCEKRQSAYLLGWTRLGGWWYWYAVASLIKIPLPALVLFGLALSRVPTALRDRDLIWATLCLLVPAAEAVLLISATTGTGSNAAFRYLLPSLSLLCVWAGCSWSAGSRDIRWISIALLGWLAANAVVAVPDHLGWQNELGWGWSRSSGRPALIGDSLDWGQDLARLGDWTSRHSTNGDTIVCVYGLGDGEAYGLKPPSARSKAEPGDRATYLAVSEEIIVGQSVERCLSVARRASFLSLNQCGALLDQQPYARVGRTIRVYRLNDLPSGLILRPSPFGKAKNDPL